MKKSFKFAMLAFAALATTFTSCSNEDDVINPGVDGEKGLLTVSFSPVGLGTKALDLTHTGAESKISNVSLIVFRSNGGLERIIPLKDTDLTDQGAGAYKLTNPVEVIAEDDKAVYVGINLPASLEADINTNAAGAMNMSTVYTALIDSMSRPNNFTMFSDSVKKVNVVAGNTVTTAAGITVSRLAAKVSVKFDKNVFTNPVHAVAGGKIKLDSLVWAVENTNPNFRILRPNGTTAFSPTISRLTPPAITSYNQVLGDNPLGAKEHDTIPQYIMENIPDTTGLTQTTLSNVVTYVRINALFTPDVVYTNGTATASVPGTEGTTFFTAPHPDGGVYYFDTEANATTWVTANNPGKPVIKYTGGKCSYGVFISKTSGKFDVVRNHYYAVTIKAINGIGVSPDPENPVPPIVKGKLDFDLQVNDWVDNSSDEELS